MITSIIINIAELIIGLAGGLAVGGGFVAFITLLGIIPRLVQISKADKFIHAFGTCVLAGSILGTYLSFTDITWNLSTIILLIWGGFHGVFNGMLAAALTEVLNVFPVLTKRIGVQRYLLWLLMAIVFGKIFGSLFQWLIFVK
ncbi:stage V sporulation protein AB [Virgibacillus alimentarius]|uniref:Stage V sporulation protein AB n=1 Tax=Virgibacillus alimentarius TaxID=698769 RepID=A0ABS4S4K6_9BACI|nr:MULTISPECIES: stage V sporulation protein AB [Virgibacillus]MBP2256424.1 stage V sporulation protein AB [Virgibacillus alimentarius]HLR66369.1 stage V sporulation protein AB [Virgibacillus sp.]